MNDDITIHPGALPETVPGYVEPQHDVADVTPCIGTTNSSFSVPGAGVDKFRKARNTCAVAGANSNAFRALLAWEKKASAYQLGSLTAAIEKAKAKRPGKSDRVEVGGMFAKGA